jgi:hypothetical protein
MSVEDDLFLKKLLILPTQTLPWNAVALPSPPQGVHLVNQHNKQWEVKVRCVVLKPVHIYHFMMQENSAL